MVILNDNLSVVLSAWRLQRRYGGQRQGVLSGEEYAKVLQKEWEELVHILARVVPKDLDAADKIAVSTITNRIGQIESELKTIKNMNVAYTGVIKKAGK